MRKMQSAMPAPHPSSSVRVCAPSSLRWARQTRGLFLCRCPQQEARVPSTCGPVRGQVRVVRALHASASLPAGLTCPCARGCGKRSQKSPSCRLSDSSGVPAGGRGGLALLSDCHGKEQRWWELSGWPGILFITAHSEHWDGSGFGQHL